LTNKIGYLGGLLRVLLIMVVSSWVAVLAMVAALCRAAAGGDGVELLDGWVPP
jgi:hypothetical protein